MFTGQSPFPWHNFSRLLTPDGFELLYREYPPLSLFEKHVGLERAGGQRPHNRYYLAYEHSIYEQIERQDAGEVKHADLPEAWQAFIEEINNSPDYRAFSERLLGGGPYAPRFAWHVGITGSEVSPHRDSENKIGTHIFYFNTSEDWDMAWGGSTLVLDGKKVEVPNPDFSDFTSETASELRDNHSFLFKNTPEAWHGVKTLTCPEGKYRRLFNVIFHEAPKKRGIGDRLRKIFGGK